MTKKIEIEACVKELRKEAVRFDREEKESHYLEVFDTIEKIYRKCIEAVKEDKPLTYKQLALDIKMIAYPWEFDTKMREMNSILGFISEFEVDRGRGMLSAAIVRVDTQRGAIRMPGEGFWRLAEDLGIFNGKKDEKLKFWCSQLKILKKIWD